MWQIITLPLVFAALNRFRGGGLWAEKVPSHPRYYVWAVVAVLSWLHFGLHWKAAAFTSVFIAWSLAPWGDYLPFGNGNVAYRAPHSRGASWAFFCCLGALVTVGMIILQASSAACVAAALFGPVSCLAYELGWDVQHKQGATFTDIAEPVIGLHWGLILALA